MRESSIPSYLSTASQTYSQSIQANEVPASARLAGSCDDEMACKVGLLATKLVC